MNAHLIGLLFVAALVVFLTTVSVIIQYLAHAGERWRQLGTVQQTHWTMMMIKKKVKRETATMMN